MDETTIKSIDTSRASDFRFKAITSERAFREMTAKDVVEPVTVKEEEPKAYVDIDSDESRPHSVEPKEMRLVEDDLNDEFQAEGDFCKKKFFCGQQMPKTLFRYKDPQEPAVSQEWAGLLSEKEIHEEESRRKTRHTAVKKTPIRETLDIHLDKFSRCVEGYRLLSMTTMNVTSLIIFYRTMDNAQKAFNLPTGYNLPDQEYITNEEDKDKVQIDCLTANPDDYTLEQMEDVVKGWIRHINKVLKANRTTVRK